MHKLSWQQILLIVLAIIIIIWLISLVLCTKPVVPVYYQPSSQLIQPMQLVSTPKYNSESVDLSTHNSDMIAPRRKSVLYYFYSPDCGHCTNFSPIWNEFSNGLKHDSNVVPKAVKVTDPENETLVFYYNIKQVPTIILATPNKTIEYSSEDKSTQNLHNFITSNLN
ncbi:thioredoxin [Cotonvirus japonicus]|uniref:Thioredoxin n=1 Tax=Cotonvirus japonicus TaxID=2811091 RepID=A0ABM7NSF8_9VIRU|nr:thioredoxin [Cotonvirus japonicus]BCS83098.1 thioredoxin [Cotonvirus japonicus]